MNFQRLFIRYLPYLYLLFLSLLQIPIFIAFWYYYSTSNSFKCLCKKLNVSFLLAKTSASLINFNSCILIFTLCKIIRQYYYIPSHIINSFHITSSIYIFIWSIVHISSHYFNFKKLNNHSFMTSIYGSTGILLFVILSCQFLVNIPIIKKYWYHKFYLIHNILFISYIIFISIHQFNIFCLFKTTQNTCSLPTFWIWCGLPILLYFFETIYKYFKQIIVHNVVYHNNITEIQLYHPNIDNISSGSLILLCCPNISYFEWHPFIITSVNKNSNLFSVHFKSIGNWTSHFNNYLGIRSNHQLFYSYSYPTIVPKLLYHGPFKHYATSFISNVLSSDSIFVISGIGSTTYYHLFRYLIDNTHKITLQHKLNIHIIIKHPNEIKWLLDILYTLHDLYPSIYIYLYFTSITNSQLHYHNNNINNIKLVMSERIIYKYQRPDLYNLLLLELVSSNTNYTTNLYYSGNHQVLKDIQTHINLPSFKSFILHAY